MAPRTKPLSPNESAPAESVPTSDPKTDWGYRIIIAGVVGVVVWLLAMPWAGWVTETTMRRFHLQSGSFPRWAAQFPIPGMYNFANRYRIRATGPIRDADNGESPLGQRAEPPVWRHANHFPARVFTFGDGRYKRLRDGRTIRVDLESRYRGRSFASEFELRPIENTTGYEVIRRPPRWSAEGDDDRDAERPGS